MRLALVLAAVEPGIGGVLLRGDKGSAKTTAARALAALLPGEAPFVELPVGATEDRVVGSLDLRAVLHDGSPRFAPGLLAQAHGGVLYVDEVNLLPDHLVDVLLDVAVSGTNRVEREGVSHEHPSRFVLVGSMNPEEGELRPQLLDRFGLAVAVRAPDDPAERAEALRRRLAFDADPAALASRFADEEATLAARLANWRPAPLAPGLIEAVVELCRRAGAEGLRADLVICKAAAALAGFEGRSEAGVEEVRRVAPLALAHRRRSPFDPPPDGEVVAALLTNELAQEPEGEAANPESAPEEPGGHAEAPPSPPSPGLEPPAALVVRGPAAPGRGGRGERASGGRLVGARRPRADEPVTAVAPLPTALASARRRGAGGGGPVIAEEDLYVPERRRPEARLVVFVVDASGSMGVEARIEAARRAVMSLLVDAYQRRDRVALVTFAGERATVVLRPTASTEVARARLAQVATGGRTPLAAGLKEAGAVVAEGARGGLKPLLVVLSDGRATAAEGDRHPVQAALEEAAELRRLGIDAVVVDCESGGGRLGLGASLAEALGATHVVAGGPGEDELLAAVRELSRSR